MGSDSDWAVMQDAAAGAGRVRHRRRGAGGLGASHAGSDVRLRARRGRPRHRGDHRRCRRRGAPARDGRVAATPLPVIGVPVPLASLDGLDSLLSIVQMPAGVPVATRVDRRRAQRRPARRAHAGVVGPGAARPDRRLPERAGRERAGQGCGAADSSRVKLPASSKQIRRLGDGWLGRKSLVRSVPTARGTPRNCGRRFARWPRRRSLRTPPTSTRTPGSRRRRWTR